MVLVRKKNYKKTAAYGVIIAIAFIFGGYLVYNSMRPASNVNVNVNTSLVGYPPIITGFGQEVFSQENYQNLFDFAGDQLPINNGDIQSGKRNPFKLSQ